MDLSALLSCRSVNNDKQNCVAKLRSPVVLGALALLALVLLTSASASAQALPDVEQGMKPYGSYHGGSIDQVSLTNGNLTVEASLLAYSQRGGDLAYPIVLRYNNKAFSIYQPPCPPGTKLGSTSCPLSMTVIFSPNPLRTVKKSFGNSVTVAYEGLPNWGTGNIDTSVSFNGTEIYVQPPSVVMPDGSVRQLASSNTGLVTIDGSGYVWPNGGNLMDRSGTRFPAPGSSAEDRNGNQFTTTSTGWIDTLGRTIPFAPTVPLPPATPNPSTANLSSCPSLNYSFQSVTYAYTWSLPTVGGGTLPLILCYTSVYVRTNYFGGATGPHYFDVNQAFPMLQSVVLPDNTYWAFEYDAADPNNTSSYGFGDLLKLTFPTGGSISYTWALSTGVCNTGFDRAVQSRTVDANDGTGPHTWHYNLSSGVVTDPLGDDTVHTITGLGANLLSNPSCSLYETQTQYYQGSHTSGTLLKTLQTDYQYTVNPYDSGFIGSNCTQNNATTVTNVFPIRVTTTLPNGMASKVESDYDTALAYHGALDGITYNILECPDPIDSPNSCFYGDQQTNPVTNYTGSYGKVIAKREYDWGQGAPGPLLRQTKTTYQWQSNSAYLTANLMDLPASVQALDGSGNQVSMTTYGYDESSLNPSGVSTQFTTTPPNGSVRGNLTSTHHWLNGNAVATTSCPNAISNGYVVSYNIYNDTGTVYQSTDACGTSAGDPNHTTTHTYSSTYAGAYPTQTCNPKSQCVSGAYDLSTGLITSFTDANNQTSSFSYDQQWRLTQALGPLDPATNLHPETDFDYSIPNQVKRKKLQSSGIWIYDYAYFDGFGRTKQTRLVDPAGDDCVDTTYDALGRVSTVSNPHRCNSSSSTDGITTTAYDALSRVTQVTHPDNTYATTTYTGRAVEFSDEGNGTRQVQRISQSDSLGRLLSACEVSSTTLSVGSSAAPAACGQDIAATGFLTSYGYDTLGNLKSVSQGGYMPRSFNYDSLSRLTQAANPESGTIIFTYDAAGNTITKTDARNIVTNYAYDTLHRLLSKTYSDGTPTASFVYDTCPTGGCPSGIAPQLTVGRMVESSVPNAQTFYSYDPMAHAAKQWQCTPANCGTNFYSFTYGYDLAGEPTSMANSLGTTLSPAYDSAAHLTGVSSNISDASHPTNLLSNVQYNALGLPSSESFGNGASESLGYDTRMRLTSVTATSPTAIGATASSGSVTVNGSERSTQTAATTATGSVTIGGTEQSATRQSCHLVRNVWTCTPFTAYDAGTVTITVNGFQASYTYGQNDTSATIASALAGSLNAGSPVTASVNGSTISLTSNVSGAAGNYSLSAGSSSSASFSPPSFSASTSGSTLTGGADAFTTYDSGTVTVTLNGAPTQVSYGSGSTASSIASALAGGLNNGTLVNASANGNVVSFTSRITGSGSNYSLSASSSSSAGFSPVSFAASASGAAMTGGNGATSGTIYSVGLAYAPNSNVLSANDSGNGNWTYGYDDFNRLVASNKNSGQQTYSYVYDRFGNRWQQNASQGGSQFLATYTGGNNRLDGAPHDASGNMTQDASTGANYTYDAENRIAQVNGGAGAGGVSYVYDADGQRVEKNVNGVKTDYLYDAAGHAVVELGASGTVNRQELFAGGKHLGTYVNNTTYFSRGDWLGTERVRSDMTGAACESIQSLPFGDGQSTAGSCGDPSTRHYTGKERDSETGLDYFGARYYSNGLGRFSRPDDPFADQHSENPQSWNLYAYVQNSPVTNSDPNGNYCVSDGKGGWVDDGNGGESCDEVDENNKWSDPSAVVVGVLDDDERIQVLANDITDLTSLSSLCEVGREGLTYAELVRGIWELPALLRGGWKMVASWRMASKMARARALGEAGEDLANIVKNTERIPSYTGAAYRVPDVLDHANQVIGEVKYYSTSKVYLTSQIRDDIAYAAQNGYTMNLWVRAGQQFSQPVQQLIDSGIVNVIHF